MHGPKDSKSRHYDFIVIRKIIFNWALTGLVVEQFRIAEVYCLYKSVSTRMNIVL